MAKKMAAGAGGDVVVGDSTMSSMNGGARATPTTRTTLVLPITVDQNLELFAVKMGLPKGEIIKRVLVEYLIKQGLQPDKRPRSINVAY
jgi:hypothetical protein